MVVAAGAPADAVKAVFHGGLFPLALARRADTLEKAGFGFVFLSNRSGSPFLIQLRASPKPHLQLSGVSIYITGNIQA